MGAGPGREGPASSAGTWTVRRVVIAPILSTSAIRFFFPLRPDFFPFLRPILVFPSFPSIHPAMSQSAEAAGGPSGAAPSRESYSTPQLGGLSSHVSGDWALVHKRTPIQSDPVLADPKAPFATGPRGVQTTRLTGSQGPCSRTEPSDRSGGTGKLCPHSCISGTENRDTAPNMALVGPEDLLSSSRDPAEVAGWSTGARLPGEGGPPAGPKPDLPQLTCGPGAEARPGVLPGDTPLTTEHIVSPGETILSLAIRSGLEPHEFCKLNQLPRYATLQVGQSVQLPLRPSQSAASDTRRPRSGTSGLASGSLGQQRGRHGATPAATPQSTSRSQSPSDPVREEPQRGSARSQSATSRTGLRDDVGPVRGGGKTATAPPGPTSCVETSVQAFWVSPDPKGGLPKLVPGDLTLLSDLLVFRREPIQDADDTELRDAAKFTRLMNTRLLCFVDVRVPESRPFASFGGRRYSTEAHLTLHLVFRGSRPLLHRGPGRPALTFQGISSAKRRYRKQERLNPTQASLDRPQASSCKAGQEPKGKGGGRTNPAATVAAVGPPRKRSGSASLQTPGGRRSRRNLDSKHKTLVLRPLSSVFNDPLVRWRHVMLDVPREIAGTLVRDLREQASANFLPDGLPLPYWFAHASPYTFPRSALALPEFKLQELSPEDEAVPEGPALASEVGGDGDSPQRIGLFILQGHYTFGSGGPWPELAPPHSAPHDDSHPISPPVVEPMKVDRRMRPTDPSYVPAGPVHAGRRPTPQTPSESRTPASPAEASGVLIQDLRTPPSEPATIPASSDEDDDDHEPNWILLNPDAPATLSSDPGSAEGPALAKWGTPFDIWAYLTGRAPSSSGPLSGSKAASQEDELVVYPKRRRRIQTLFFTHACPTRACVLGPGPAAPYPSEILSPGQRIALAAQLEFRFRVRDWFLVYSSARDGRSYEALTDRLEAVAKRAATESWPKTASGRASQDPFWPGQPQSSTDPRLVDSAVPHAQQQHERQQKERELQEQLQRQKQQHQRKKRKLARLPHLLVISTTNGDIVGGFATHIWCAPRARVVVTGTAETFLFTFRAVPSEAFAARRALVPPPAPPVLSRTLHHPHPREIALFSAQLDAGRRQWSLAKIAQQPTGTILVMPRLRARDLPVPPQVATAIETMKGQAKSATATVFPSTLYPQAAQIIDTDGFGMGTGETFPELGNETGTSSDEGDEGDQGSREDPSESVEGAASQRVAGLWIDMNLETVSSVPCADFANHPLLSAAQARASITAIECWVFGVQFDNRFQPTF